jgi:uncharacterized membrane protein YgcG
MSAHYAAPAIRRTQMATPPVRRKALFVAAATLCAPAFAALALAAFAASGGSDRPAMGSLTGTEGLRGTTTPSMSASPSPSPVKYGSGERKGDWSDSNRSPHVPKHPSSQAPTRPPAHHAPATPPPHAKPTPKTHVNTPAPPTYDPTEPGAPTSSGTTGTTGGTSGSGSGSTSGSGSGSGPGGSADGNDAYPGGA